MEGDADRGADDPRRLDICARRELARPELEAGRHRSGLTHVPRGARMTEAPRPVEVRQPPRRNPSCGGFNSPIFPAGRDDDHAAAFGRIHGGRAADRRHCRPRRARSASTARPAASGARSVGGDKARLPQSPRANSSSDRSSRTGSIARGFVTGYYEPEVEASRVPTERFSVPLYRRPGDLVEVRDEKRPPGWDPEMRFARRSDDGSRALLRSRSDRGGRACRPRAGARLAGEPGRRLLHPCAGLGAAAACPMAARCASPSTARPGTPTPRSAGSRSSAAFFARGKADKDGLEAWLKSHPEEGRALMRENRSFIFFRETATRGGRRPARRRRRAAHCRSQPRRRPHAPYLPHADLGRSAGAGRS